MPAFFDVFNGDADGICALHQFRLSTPCPNSKRITGVKRDIQLLSVIDTICDATISVFDISLDSNRSHLLKLLGQNNQIKYVDHHFAGDIPQSTSLETHIDTSPQTCTSLLVLSMVDKKHPKWAICGAFGDNLHKQAESLASSISMDSAELQKLKEIGELLNYNGYGTDISDLHFSPSILYDKVSEFSDPLVFYHESNELKILKQGFEQDMANALQQEPVHAGAKNRVYKLPDEPWARRVSGVFANVKARENRTRAHALITNNSDGTWRISVRAPFDNRQNADILCKSFPTGGGRAAAAGINNLPKDMLDSFFSAFENTYS